MNCVIFKQIIGLLFRIIILPIFLFFNLQSVTASPTYLTSPVCVAPDGSGTSCTPLNPCALQYGVDNVEEGGTVFAAEGTYVETPLTSDQVLLIDRSVIVAGGWQRGTSLENLIVNPEIYISIIDGQHKQRGVTVTSVMDSSLSGFTIQNGNATNKITFCPEGDPSGCGGGILVAEGAYFRMAGCTIEDNVATTISTTTGNKVTGYGGGMFIYKPAFLYMNELIIRNNTASASTDPYAGTPGIGGGLFYRGDYPGGVIELHNSQISGNEVAPVEKEGMGIGAGIVIADNSNGVFNNNSISSNNSHLKALGSALTVLNASTKFSQNRIVNNHGSGLSEDMAIWLFFYTGTMSQNVIINPDTRYGVVLQANNTGTFSTLDNNVIAHHVEANVMATSVLSTLPATVQMAYNTIDQSQYGVLIQNYATVNFSGGIISHHTIAGFTKDILGGQANAAFTLFHENTSDGLMDINKNPLSGEPAFVNPTSWDYHILSTSAAIDQVPAGNNPADLIDFDGDLRPMGSANDAGADEFWWKYQYLPIISK